MSVIVGGDSFAMLVYQLFIWQGMNDMYAIC